MSFLDTTLALLSRSQNRQAAKAIQDRQWKRLAGLLEEGLSPNEELPARLFPVRFLQGGGSTTTPFLAMSVHRMKPNEDGQSARLYEAFKLALEKGADLCIRGQGDMRGAIEHQANLHNLPGWQLIAAHRTVDFDALIELAEALSWEEGSAWAHVQKAHDQANRLAQATPPTRMQPTRRF